MGFSPWKIRVAFPRESQLRQSRATQPAVHVGCFSVSIIHRTLTWTTGSLTCAQMLMHATAGEGGGGGGGVGVGAVADLVERLTVTPLTQVRFHGAARYFFSQGQLSVRTLVRCQ